MRKKCKHLVFVFAIYYCIVILWLHSKQVFVVNFSFIICYYDIQLTWHPSKKLPFPQNRFFNFWMIFCLKELLWCLKHIYISLTKFGPLYGGPVDPKVQKMKIRFIIFWNHIRWKSAGMLCQLTPYSWNFFVFPYNWENWENFANSFSRNF